MIELEKALEALEEGRSEAAIGSLIQAVEKLYRGTTAGMLEAVVEQDPSLGPFVAAITGAASSPTETSGDE